MKFLVFGSAGMAGHTISIYLSENGHSVTGFDKVKSLITSSIIGDARDTSKITQIVCEGGYDYVINCVGVLNQFAENNHELAVYLNSYFPHFLSYITKDIRTNVIHMSTDCVFSGKTGNYHENSLRDGETFYDRSKALGEIENSKDLTFRNSIIGPDLNPEGIGLFNWFMKQNSDLTGFDKAIWTGVTTLTLAKAMEKAAENRLTGLYNLVNNSSISKHDMLVLFNKYFKDNRLIIKRNDTFSLNKSLVNNRKDFNFIVPPYEKMFEEMKEWIDCHKDLYPHYFI